MSAQDSKLSVDIQDSIFKQLKIYPQEKIHLHIDRDKYVPGEKIWFKAYVTDALTHSFPTYSQYVYVELISSSDVLVNRVMINKENGMFYGHLLLTEKLPVGKYTIRAYTRYMENMGDDYFFKKNIEIGSLSPENDKKNRHQPEITDDYDVSFFPEGGYLLEGVFCKVAFKALNEKGYSENISGQIIDENGVVVSEVKTSYAGMGAFLIIAEKGKKYYLECRNSNGTKKRFLLPVAYDNVYTINAQWNNKGKLYVTLNKAASSPDIPHYLLVLSKGVMFYFIEWDRNNDYFIIDKDKIPSGVVQLLFLDKDMNPVSERLTFNKVDDQIKTVFSTGKEVYEKRDLVSSTIQLSDPEGNNLGGDFSGGNLSVSITDDKDISVDSLTTITSSLLLSSELKGYIETPAYYFQDNNESSFALDLLMMTHGWRRYNIPEVIKGNMEMPEKPVEASKEVSGMVKGLVLGKPVEKSEVTIMSSTGGFLQTETNGKGEFLFAGIDAPDSVQFFVQSMNKKGKPTVELVVNKEVFPKLKHIPHFTGVKENIVEVENEEGSFMKKAEQRSNYDDDMLLIQLEEVLVTARAPERKDEPRFNYWANAASDKTIRREEIDELHISRIEHCVFLIPGTTVQNDQIYFMKLLFIDGPPVEDPTTEPLQKGLPALLIVDGMIVEDITEVPHISDIESIDVFKDTRSGYLFGMRGAGGAISFTTKVGGKSGNKQMFNFTVLSPLGYQKPVEFYSPKYDTPVAKNSGNPDFRTTIFWKPNIVVNEKGEAHFEFYTSDFATTYSVVIEGLSDDGQIIRHVEKIEVR